MPQLPPFTAPMWRCEYRESGGYDSMSSAYYIIYGGHYVFDIDVADFIDRDAVMTEDDRWAARNSENQSAQGLAEKIVRLLNRDAVLESH